MLKLIKKVIFYRKILKNINSKIEDNNNQSR